MARPQRSMPELLQMGLEAEQRVIRTSAGFLGIVTQPRPLGFPVEGEHHGVQIENQCGSPLGESKELGAKLVVQSHELTDRLGGKPLEESAQRGLIGKASQSQQGEKRALVLQDLGLVDAPQTRHDGIKESQDEIGGKVSGTALRNFDEVLQQPAEFEFVAKTLKEHHPTEVSKLRIFER